jgi:hypothetical protein
MGVRNDRPDKPGLTEDFWMLVSNLKPDVSRNWRIALAGMLWSGVGIMLCRMGVLWLLCAPTDGPAYGAAGLILALLAHKFAFSKIATKNIRRLFEMPDRSCLFGFQAWKSYLIIVFMIALGFTLRHSPVPRHFLAVIYLAVGGALLLSSLSYYICLWQALARRTGRN